MLTVRLWIKSTESIPRPAFPAKISKMQILPDGKQYADGYELIEWEEHFIVSTPAVFKACARSKLILTVCYFYYICQVISGN